MKNIALTIFSLLIVSGVLYYGSFLLFTNKYMVQYTSGTCDIARTVKHEWQREIYYPAAAIELKLFGKKPHKPTIQIHSKELHEYFDAQKKICETEN